MKILFLSWENLGTRDVIDAMVRCGHEVILLKTSQEGLLGPDIGNEVASAMRDNSCDLVFGINYFENVGKAAAEHGFDYYSWVYDNPSSQLYTMSVTYPTSHVYVFDTDTYYRLQSVGVKNIKFLPMAAAPDRLSEQIAGFKMPGEDSEGFVNDIAFIGSFYHEKHNFYDRMIEKGISAYTEGYLRGLMEAQKQIYGVDLAGKCLNDTLMADMHTALPLEPTNESFMTKRMLYSEFVINRKITSEERFQMMSALGRTFGTGSGEGYRVSLYTHDGSIDIKGCKNKGETDPYLEAPKVYNKTRINLNISLRSIVNGIPLRCFDIMGAGGFLLTSYAGDMQMFFEEGTDYVSFESLPDLLDKCGYYLKHEDERKEIAQNGLKRITEAHTFDHRIREIFG
ncbi:MAG: glycosyltransferase [Lachnospiraceae bacterium]|nr:glycosyltransferase [Lachnospiraceae bacterium]